MPHHDITSQRKKLVVIWRLQTIPSRATKTLQHNITDFSLQMLFCTWMPRSLISLQDFALWKFLSSWIDGHFSDHKLDSSAAVQRLSWRLLQTWHSSGTPECPMGTRRKVLDSGQTSIFPKHKMFWAFWRDSLTTISGDLGWGRMRSLKSCPEWIQSTSNFL